MLSSCDAWHIRCLGTETHVGEEEQVCCCKHFCTIEAPFDHEQFDIDDKDQAYVDRSSGLSKSVVHTSPVRFTYDFFHGALRKFFKLGAELVDVLLSKADNSAVVDDNV